MPKRSAASSIGNSAKKGKGKSADAEDSGVVTVGGAVHSCGGQRLDSLAASNVESFYKALEPSCFLERGRVLTETTEPKRDDATCVLYWMFRDQRAEDNWALTFAREAAKELDLPLVVVFNFVPSFLGATLRQDGFMLRGMAETEASLRVKQVPFYILQESEDPGSSVAAFATAGKSPSSSSSSSSSAKKEASAPPSSTHRAALVFTDMTPLRTPMKWVKDAAACLDAQDVPLVQVDAHNVVPVWCASDKQEVGARTIRSKITAQLPHFMPNIPPPLEANAHQLSTKGALPPAIDWEEVLDSIKELDRSVKEVDWATPGSSGGKAQLDRFCADFLKIYADDRNNPNDPQALSNLSPWFRFGQIAPQRAALTVKAASAQSSTKSSGSQSFVEEAVVRRELSDNFCFYQEHYDSLEGAAGWAQDSLALHSKDHREWTYDETQLENAATHDDLWNAAQIQLRDEGKMHGFLRMYWAKKILEWSLEPAEALRVGIYLNDKYEIDGRDPNGYVGVMWSVCGIHDMGWTERQVFGKIRYMNYAGCLRKFDVAAFVDRYSPEAREKCVAAGGEPAVAKKPKKKAASSPKKAKK